MWAQRPPESDFCPKALQNASRRTHWNAEHSQMFLIKNKTICIRRLTSVDWKKGNYISWSFCNWLSHWLGKQIPCESTVVEQTDPLHWIICRISGRQCLILWVILYFPFRRQMGKKYICYLHWPRLPFCYLKVIFLTREWKKMPQWCTVIFEVLSATFFIEKDNELN